MNKTSVAINSKCTGSLITAQFGDLKKDGERERERMSASHSHKFRDGQKLGS